MVLATSVALTGCLPGSPPATPKPGAGATPKPAAAAAAKASPTPLPDVAAPAVQLVRDGKIDPASPAVHVFLWGQREAADRDLKLAKEAGFVWVKQRFEWRNIE